MYHFLLIFMALFLGYALQKKYRFSQSLPQILNQYIIYIALPAMIFLELPKISLSYELIIPVVVSWVVMGLSALLVLLAAWIFSFDEKVTGALLLVSVLTNSTFLGIPIITTLYGSPSLPYIIVYDQLGSFLALSTYGTVVVALYAHKSRVNLLMIGFRVLTFPPFIALAIALFLLPLSFSKTLESSLSLLSQSIPPIALFAIGLQLRFRLPKEELLPFTTALFIKLIVAPAVAVYLAYLMAWEGLAIQVSILEAGMAPMITAAAMASMVGLAPRLASAIAGYGILISFGTTALIYFIIN